VQLPALQLIALAFGAEQKLPQTPQLFTLLARLVSQPLEGCPSQLPQLALQEAIWQAPNEEPAQSCCPVPFEMEQLRVSLTQAPLSTW
jgi:hypothetical protein